MGNQHVLKGDEQIKYVSDGRAYIHDVSDGRTYTCLITTDGREYHTNVEIEYTPDGRRIMRDYAAEARRREFENSLREPFYMPWRG